MEGNHHTVDHDGALGWEHGQLLDYHCGDGGVVLAVADGSDCKFDTTVGS